MDSVEMMNKVVTVGFDVILAGVFLLSILNGGRKGLGASILGILASGLSLVIALSFSGKTADRIYENMAKPIIVDKIEQKLPDDLPALSVSETVGSVINNLPAGVKKTLSENYSQEIGSISSEIALTGLDAHNAAERITETAIRPAAINALRLGVKFGIFILARLILKILGGFFLKLFAMPGLDTVNTWLGLLFGAAKGAVIVYFLCVGAAFIAGLLPEGLITQFIGNSKIADYLLGLSIKI